MSRVRKRHLEALKELTEEAERLDFVEKNHALISFTDGHWYCFVRNEHGCAHSGNQPTARAAIDKAREDLTAQMNEHRSFTNWIKRMFDADEP